MKRIIELEELDPKHWKPTYIFPDLYLISDKGELYSKRRKRLVPGNIDGHGYPSFTLCNNNDRRHIRAHRLVAMAFIPNPSGKPCIDHINTDKTDNRVSNLHWVTHKENSHNPLTLVGLEERGRERFLKLAEMRRKGEIHYRHTSTKGMRFKGKAIEVYKDGVSIGAFKSIRLAADTYGLSDGNIGMCLSGKRKHTKGYTFKRIREV
ncbi:MAG: HNH endonuclease [Aeriscardovia sp.]|nr:HNH endonuclease [Aeriscardovia sp.]